MVNKETLKTLIDLSPYSMTTIAQQADVNQANLSAWFTQNRYMSEEAILRLEEALGVVDDELTTDRVFVWRTELDLSRLQELLDRYFDNPKLIPVVKKRVRPYTLEDLYSQPLALVVDDLGHMAVLIMKYTESEKVKIIGPKVPWFSPEFLRRTEWLLKGDSDDLGCPGMVKVSTTLFQELKKGKVNPDDVKQLLESIDSVDWQDVIELAKNKKMTPEDVYDLLNKY